jgi:outer membrane lipoprotein-sorting protein
MVNRSWGAFGVRLGAALLAVVLPCLLPTGAPAGTALDRLVGAWSSVDDYSVTIEAHEALGKSSQDRVLHYAFRKPAQARLDLMAGTRSVATILWSGGDSVVAYRSGLSFLRIRGSAEDRRFTSLRGNGVRTPVLGDIVACFERHQSSVEVRSGPVVNGQPTDEIVLERAGISCAGDSPADRAVTRDIIEVSRRGTILMRRRYEGPELVEAWNLRDYRINAGFDDRVFN